MKNFDERSLKDQDQILSFNIRVMKILTLWPEEQGSFHKILNKHTILLLSFLYTVYTLIHGLIRIIFDPSEGIIALLDIVIALVAITAMEYMSQCLIRNIETIKNLVLEIKHFYIYGGAQEIWATEKKIRKYTKAILIYGIIGNLCYGLFKLYDVDDCVKNRTSDLILKHDPCGLIVRQWAPFEISEYPWFEIHYLAQMYICILTSIIVLAITMLLVGLLMYVVTFLQHCRNEILKCFHQKLPDDVLRLRVRFLIEYHKEILMYSKNVTRAFSSMMLMHITLTSMQISVLGFEALMVESLTDSLRFGMHLLGWLILLFLICFYGQQIIDQSTGVGNDIYSTTWYNSPLCVQKDLYMMIMRSQRPLTLSAASLGVMSLETFLGVLTTAYSYFTLLLNIKNKSGRDTL